MYNISYASFRLLLRRFAYIFIYIKMCIYSELYEYASLYEMRNWSDKFCTPAIWNSIILKLSHKYRTRFFITICLFYTCTKIYYYLRWLRERSVLFLLFWCWTIYFCCCCFFFFGYTDTMSFARAFFDNRHTISCECKTGNKCVYLGLVYVCVCMLTHKYWIPKRNKICLH